jgi:hypothetical protein
MEGSGTGKAGAQVGLKWALVVLHYFRYDSNMNAECCSLGTGENAQTPIRACGWKMDGFGAAGGTARINSAIRLLGYYDFFKRGQVK